MNAAKLRTIWNVDEELDDPHLINILTEEFVENVERTSHEETNDGLTPNEN